jgi:hypothetical protein
MKLKKLIEYLEEFDQEKEIVFFEISDLYDIMLIGIDEDEDKVYINIKNLERGKPEEPVH